MSRSFRYSDQFAEKRDQFAERKAAREARAVAFAAMGFDDAEGLADLPLFPRRIRERARRALEG
jgi:hypothetical protein